MKKMGGGVIKNLLKIFGMGESRSPITMSTEVNKVDSLPKSDSSEDKPKKPRNRRRTKAEMEVARREEAERRHKSSYAKAFEDIEKLRDAGIERFIWRSVCNEKTCSECQKLEGKNFKLDSPPPIGYPGQHKCHNRGYCICYAEPDWTGTIFDIN